MTVTVTVTVTVTMTVTVTVSLTVTVTKGSITPGEFTSYSLANLLAAAKFALCNNVV